MSEMIERVAKAIDEASDELSLAFWEIGPGDLKTIREAKVADTAKRLRQARAAIEAMREPTQSMSVAGCPSEDESGAPYCFDRTVTDLAWRAMIDAALKEPETANTASPSQFPQP